MSKKPDMQRRAKIAYVLNGRFPTKRAYGIQTAKMCEALIEAGADLTLVVPATEASRTHRSVRDFYGLRVEVPMRRLAGLDWYAGGRLGYLLSSLVFMASSLLYLLAVRGRGTRIYTVDMDSFSHALLPVAGKVIAEMHSPKDYTLWSRFFFRRARGIVAANPLIAAELKKTFGIAALVEPNGVDLGAPMAKDDARRRLGVPQQEAMALYVGRFLPWKGLDIMPGVAALVPHMTFRMLGGTKEEFEQAAGSAEGLQFAEAAPADVAVWLAAADVLLVIGTARNEYSYRYTTPMKVFEYLAAGRPVVASDTPALRSFVPEDIAVYCTPDDAPALARAITNAVSNPPDLARGAALAHEHTWRKRAERILAAYE